MAAKILWLCSWYPNKDHPFNGDFVQRQAVAVSELQDIDVLYVHKQIDTKAASIHVKQKPNENLTEHIITNPIKNNSLFQKFIGLWRYFFIHLKFIKQNGRPDLIHVQIPIKAGIVALFCKWVYGIPYIVTEHYGIYNTRYEHHFKTRNFAYRFATRLIVKNANSLTTVSNSLGEEMNNWVATKDYSVIPNVVDTSRFHYSPVIQKEVFRFIHVSNMIPVKNVGGIIAATAQLYKEDKNIETVFVGRIVNEYYQQAQATGLLNVCIFFRGEVAYHEVAKEIKDSHAMIIFSDSESQSCVVLESLCVGRPAIVTDIGGVQELVDEQNGYKVAPRDTDTLFRAMRSMKNEYRKFNQQEISERAMSLYSYNEVAKKMIALYDKVLKR